MIQSELQRAIPIQTFFLRSFLLKILGALFLASFITDDILEIEWKYHFATIYTYIGSMLPRFNDSITGKLFGWMVFHLSFTAIHLNIASLAYDTRKKEHRDRFLISYLIYAIIVYFDYGYKRSLTTYYCMTTGAVLCFGLHVLVITWYYVGKRPGGHRWLLAYISILFLAWTYDFIGITRFVLYQDFWIDKILYILDNLSIFIRKILYIIVSSLE